jgi:hypothetical protein
VIQFAQSRYTSFDEYNEIPFKVYLDKFKEKKYSVGFQHLGFSCALLKNVLATAKKSEEKRKFS